MMGLPNGTFKPLARILGPLCLWMAVGWLAYPGILTDLMERAGESIDSAEVRLFSHAMTVTCVILGVVFLAYGFSGVAPQGTVPPIQGPKGPESPGNGLT